MPLAGKGSDLDAHIDDIYKAPLAEFVTRRQTLAKTFTGDESKRVKALVKPTLVPWAANQVYWHARLAYDRVLKGGEKLRAAQVTALKGRTSDIATAAAEHRKAISEAVRTAARFVPPGAPRPDPDHLARLFEAVSLTPSPPEPHGRLTRPLQPAGFEALAGLDIKAPPQKFKPPLRVVGAPAARERAEARAQEAAARKREHAIHDAEAVFERAVADERAARQAWEAAQHRAETARRVLADLKKPE